MCGITGYFCTEGDGIGWRDSTILSDLLTAGTVRGYDGTGVIFRDAGGKQDMWHMKKAVTGPELGILGDFGKWGKGFEGGRFVVQHNRAATIGGVTDESTHPFSFEHVTGVHNGTFKAWRTMWPDSKQVVDSAALFEALNNTGETEDEILNVLKTLGYGAYALVWHDARTNKLYFARNDQRPLYLCMTPDGLWFASERRMLEWILNRNKETMLYGCELGIETLVTIDVETGVGSSVQYDHNTAYNQHYKTDKDTTKQGWWKRDLGGGDSWNATQEEFDAALNERYGYSDTYYDDDDNKPLDPWDLLRHGGEE